MYIFNIHLKSKVEKIQRRAHTSLRHVSRNGRNCITLCSLVSVFTTVQVRQKPKAIASVGLRNTTNAFY